MQGRIAMVKRRAFGFLRWAAGIAVALTPAVCIGDVSDAGGQRAAPPPLVVAVAPVYAEDAVFGATSSDHETDGDDMGMSEDLARDAEQVAEGITDLLEMALQQTPDIALVERSEANRLQEELALGLLSSVGDPSLRPGYWERAEVLVRVWPVTLAASNQCLRMKAVDLKRGTTVAEGSVPLKARSTKERDRRIAEAMSRARDEGRGLVIFDKRISGFNPRKITLERVDVDLLQERIRDLVAKARKRMDANASRKRVLPLYFSTEPPRSRLLADVERELLSLFSAEAEREGRFVSVDFPEAGDAADEEYLVLGGFVRKAAERQSTLADWYVWGSCVGDNHGPTADRDRQMFEAPWVSNGVPSAPRVFLTDTRGTDVVRDCPMRLTLSLWNGVSDPLTIEVATTYLDRHTSYTQVLASVAALIDNPAPDSEVPEDHLRSLASQLAEEAGNRHKAFLPDMFIATPFMLGGDSFPGGDPSAGAFEHMSHRWQLMTRIWEMAHLFNPVDAAIARERVATRFGYNMRGAWSEHKWPGSYLDAKAARAWIAVIEQYGYDFALPFNVPIGPHTTCPEWRFPPLWKSTELGAIGKQPTIDGLAVYAECLREFRHLPFSLSMWQSNGPERQQKERVHHAAWSRMFVERMTKALRNPSAREHLPVLLRRFPVWLEDITEPALQVAFCRASLPLLRKGLESLPLSESQKTGYGRKFQSLMAQAYARAGMPSDEIPRVLGAGF